MDVYSLTPRQAELAGVKEAKQRGPLTFWSIVGGVIVGNVAFGLIVAALYELLRLIS